jgi:hypothetical protein
VHRAAWLATPSSHTISSALRVGIESFGIPQILYVDNGKDYEKVGRIDFSPECSGVLVRLGIEGQYCLPRHPQSKLIESWFGTVRKRFDCLWPSYCGPGPQGPAGAVYGCPEGAPSLSEGQTQELTVTPGQRVYRYSPAVDRRIQLAASPWRTRHAKPHSG